MGKIVFYNFKHQQKNIYHVFIPNFFTPYIANLVIRQNRICRNGD